MGTNPNNGVFFTPVTHPDSEAPEFKNKDGSTNWHRYHAACKLVQEENPTLTKREYFAALALQGLVWNPDHVSTNMIAETAVQYADALIKQLNKGQ